MEGEAVGLQIHLFDVPRTAGNWTIQLRPVIYNDHLSIRRNHQRRAICTSLSIQIITDAAVKNRAVVLRHNAVKARVLKRFLRDRIAAVQLLVGNRILIATSNLIRLHGKSPFLAHAPAKF